MIFELPSNPNPFWDCVMISPPSAHPVSPVLLNDAAKDKKPAWAPSFDWCGTLATSLSSRHLVKA